MLHTSRIRDGALVVWSQSETLGACFRSIAYGPEKNFFDLAHLFLSYAPLSTVYNDAPLEATPGICTPCYGSKTGRAPCLSLFPKEVGWLGQFVGKTCVSILPSRRMKSSCK